MAMASARRALEIDPELAEAHAALAYSNLYDWNWDAAEKGFELSIRLNPNYAPAHLWFAHYFAARSDFDRAVQEVQLAADLDPLSPIVQTQVAWILSHAHRYPEAIRQFRKVLSDDPTYQWALWQLGSVLIAVGNFDEGIPILEKYVQESNRSASSLGTLGQAYARSGRRQHAEALLNELLVRSRGHYVPPHAFVHIYVGLRDREKVFEFLEKSYEERSNSLLWLGTDQRFPFRSDPRFDNLLRRIGLK
jgi:tetratricopeptide (TPR) repeat protein